MRGKWIILAALLLLFPGWAQAQTETEPAVEQGAEEVAAQAAEQGTEEASELAAEDAVTDAAQEGEDYASEYEPEEHGARRFSLGIAGGVVRIDEDADFFVLGNFRFNSRLGSSVYSRHLELELSYWKRDAEGTVRRPDSDLALSFNGILGFPGAVASMFIGVGVGIHYLDGVPEPDTLQLEGQYHFGANIQFGLDLKMSERIAFFGTGRLDIIEGDLPEVDTLQPKIYVGLRFDI
jgi:hypothetical protein